MNITYEKVEKNNPGKADEVWNRICEIGGFGVVKDHTGGLDISGLAEGKKKQIIELAEAKKGDK
jgi:hypothetical protein